MNLAGGVVLMVFSQLQADTNTLPCCLLAFSCCISFSYSSVSVVLFYDCLLLMFENLAVFEPNAPFRASYFCQENGT